MVHGIVGEPISGKKERFLAAPASIYRLTSTIYKLREIERLVLRLMGCLVLFYTSRVVCQGRLTMEEMIFSLKHYWRFVDCEVLELKALSQEGDEIAT